MTTESNSTVPAGLEESPGVAETASPQQRAVALANERPEVAAGAAFAGGLVFALILKRLAR